MSGRGHTQSSGTDETGKILRRGTRVKIRHTVLAFLVVLAFVAAPLSLNAYPAGAAQSGHLPPVPPSQAPGASHLSSHAAAAHPPISFEPNRGQFDPRVRFVARTPGSTLFLTSTGMVLTVERPAKNARPAMQDRLEQPAWMTRARLPRRDVLRLDFVHANRNPVIAATDRLPGIVNYFIGNNPERWYTKIPTFARVRYQGIYPGIDLVYYARQGHLEYDWLVHPGANPAQIRLRHDGGGSLRLGGRGDLLLNGSVVETHPVAYQGRMSGGRSVPVRFRLHGSGVFGVDAQRYDRSRLLVIDPQLVYSTYLGAGNSGEGRAIAADSAGNAYVTGSTWTSTVSTTPGAVQPTIVGGSTGTFVAKLDATGSQLQYMTFLVGSGIATPNDIAIDGAGNAYVTGVTSSSNFPTTSGAIQTTFGGASDAFVAKLDSTGSTLLYSTYLGGSSDDTGNGIAVDGAGNACITGYTWSSNFPTTPGAVQPAFGGAPDDAFVAKLSATGSALLYSTYLGGSGQDDGAGIAVDGSGDAYITGDSWSSNFPTTSDAYQTTLHGGADVFVTKLNSSGSTILYSTYLGGNSEDDGEGIAVDRSGRAYVTGRTLSTTFPTTPGAAQPTYGGSWDVFVTRLNAAGSGLDYSTYLGGSGQDDGRRIVLDSAGNAYVTGETTSSDLPTTPGAMQTTFGGSYDDAFVTTVNSTGSLLLYSTYLGGSGTDTARGIGMDAAGSVYVTGSTSSANFPITPGALQSAGGSHSSAFVAKINPSAATTVSVPITAGWNMVGGWPLSPWSDATATWSWNAATGSWTHPMGSEKPGAGMWEEVSSSGAREVTAQQCTAPVTVPVVAHRWNMIGNPCSMEVSLPATAQVLWWDPSISRYVPMTGIPAGVAAWVRPASDSLVMTPASTS